MSNAFACLAIVLQKATDTVPPAIEAPPGVTYEATLPTGIIYKIPPPTGVAGGVAPLTVTVTVNGSM